jgi:hypothetical protein
MIIGKSVNISVSDSVFSIRNSVRFSTWDSTHNSIWDSINDSVIYLIWRSINDSLTQNIQHENR